MKKNLIIGIIVITAMTTYLLKNDNFPKEIKFALINAKENKTELKLVLNHFKNDSLKYNAALFLITNMDNKYSKNKPAVPSHNVIKSFYLIDSITINKFLFDSCSITKNTHIKNDTVDDDNDGDDSDDTSNKISDLVNLKSGYLINHINKSFKTWNTSPLSKNLKYEDFLETILPYRYGTEILNTPENYPDSLYFSKLFKGIDKNDVSQIVDRFNFYAKSTNYLTNTNENIRLNKDFLDFYTP